MSEEVQDVNDADFESQVLKSDVPVLVDMWAPWCGPCRMVSPVIKEIARDNAGRIKAFKMNVDNNAETAAKFGISAIPTVLVFKGGREVQGLRMVGAQPRGVYQRAVEDALSG
ncbi:MAG: thioredoxin [Planctomycetes bacterium SM23_32]|nr:MAG: thioredoxin [Planctomycetes bacterium SM23_32]